jgi:hypothetical protein
MGPARVFDTMKYMFEGANKPTVTQVKTFYVLETMSFLRDEGRRQAHFQQRLSKAYEAEAKARRKS